MQTEITRSDIQAQENNLSLFLERSVMLNQLLTANKNDFIPCSIMALSYYVTTCAPERLLIHPSIRNR